MRRIPLVLVTLVACAEGEVPLAPTAPPIPPAEPVGMPVGTPVDPSVPLPPELDHLVLEARSVQLIGFSQDGARLAFTAGEDSLRSALYLYDVATREVRFIHDEVVVNIPFSPVQLSEDGARVLYRRVEDDAPGYDWIYESPLYVAGWDQAPVRLAEVALRSAYRFVPGARRAIWVAGRSGPLYVADLEAGTTRRLAGNVLAQPWDDPMVQLPVSADGGTLAYVTRPGNRSGTLALADLASGSTMSLGLRTVMGTVRFEGGGRLVYELEESSSVHRLEVRDLATAEVRSSGPGAQFARSDDGRWVARYVPSRVTNTGTVSIDDLTSGASRAVSGRVRSGYFAFVPGRALLVGVEGYGAESRVFGFDPERDERFEIAAQASNQLSIHSISPDGRRLLLNTEGYGILDYDLGSRTGAALRCKLGCSGAAFPDRGRVLVWVARATETVTELYRLGPGASEPEVIASRAHFWTLSPDQKKGVLSLGIAGSGATRLRAIDWSLGAERDLDPLEDPGASAHGAVLSNTHAAYTIRQGYGGGPHALFVGRLP